MIEVTKKIKSTALKLGFDKVGISSAEQPQKSVFLEEWLKKSYHGQMQWMLTRKEKRRDINRLFPGVKSVICVAHNYFTPFKKVPSKATVRISRYAWGEDYHRIMKKKLKQLLAEIAEIDKNINGRVCVDTAPIMDKLWAEQAGIGWQGKHTNLITRELGSWVFLGELLIDQELIYDTPAEDYCGSCQACIEACPTDAIIAPYVLDARKCISYLTIEYWDKPIPTNLAAQMSSWIFGCDICQEVCPWNKFEKPSGENRYYPSEDIKSCKTDDLLKLNEISYKNKFKKSPIRRPGWKNFLRNIHAAIGRK
jgi:epoxyqueuosine reductase